MLNYLKSQLSQVCLIINITAKYICYSKLLFNAKIFRCILLTWINYLSFSYNGYKYRKEFHKFIFDKIKYNIKQI